MLKIAYPGTLNGFQPSPRRSFFGGLKDWIWTFRVRNIDFSTRTGYYFINAIHLLKTRYWISEEDLSVDWWGSIHELNHMQVREFGLERFFRHEKYLPKAESELRMSASDLFLLPLESSLSPDGLRPLFIPGKLFEYLKFGKPILCLCGPSDSMDIIRKSGLGIFVDPRDSSCIAEVLFSIIKGQVDLSAYSPNWEFIRQLSFEHRAKDLAEVVFGLLNADRRHA